MPMAMMPFSEAKRTMLSKLRGSRKTLLPLRAGERIAASDQDGDQPEDALEAQHQIQDASRSAHGCRALTLLPPVPGPWSGSVRPPRVAAPSPLP